MIGNPAKVTPTATLHPPPTHCNATMKTLFTMFNKKLKTQYSLYTPMYRHAVLLATTEPQTLLFKVLINCFLDPAYLRKTSEFDRKLYESTDDFTKHEFKIATFDRPTNPNRLKL